MNQEDQSFPPVSPVWVGLTGRCPRCGKGRLFKGFLALQPACENCGLDLAFADSGDGPAFFVMSVVGFVVVGGALAVEILYKPPYWVHAALWLLLAFAMTLLLLRPFKGVLVALQYHHRAGEGRRASDEGP